MNQDQVLEGVKQKFQAALEHYRDELNKLRTGRASASMLDGITVEAYGTTMPLKQVSTISTPEAQLIQITPFDPGSLQAIVSAIRDNQALGLNPLDDGRVVRVPIPPLTSERRQEIVKQLHQKVEDTLISMRGSRHEALKELDQLKKDRSITEDDFNLLEKQIDDSLTSGKNEIEKLSSDKEKEIMTV
jgi:ribosome recycling factor